MLALVFIKLEIVFEISILDEEIKSSIIKDSINIVIDVALLVLSSRMRHNRLIKRCNCYYL